MQKVPSNFEIDIFKPLVAAAAEHLGLAYDPPSPDGIRIRRISDHARALTFTIHENVKPSNEKQGYVVRRLLRRAVLDAYQMGQREPFLHQIVPDRRRGDEAGPTPSSRDSVPRIQTVIREEEEQFLRNLENGLKLLNDVFRKTKAAGSEVVAGKDAFTLHATYGIPFEVTESLAADQNLRVDRAGLRRRRWTSSAGSRAGRPRPPPSSRPARSTRSRKPYHHGNEFLGYDDDLGRRHRDRHPRTEPARRLGHRAGRRARRSSWSSTGPRSTARAAARSATPGVIRGEGFVVPGRRHEEGERLHPPRRPRHRGDRLGERRRPRPRSTPTAARRSAGPTRPRTSCTTPCTPTWASTPSRPAARSSPTGSGSTSPTPRPSAATGSARSRRRSTTASSNRRAGLLDGHADRPRPGSSARWPSSARSTPRTSGSSGWATSPASFAAGRTWTTPARSACSRSIGEESVSAGTRRITALTGKAALDLVRQEEEAPRRASPPR